MSERYQRLFLLPQNLYVSAAPVIISAGALLKDIQTGKILAQIKLQNINKKRIKALTVKIKPLDTIGNPLGEEVEYQYLDLTAERDAFFGQKVPIPLPDDATRAFSIIVSEVIFADNSIWTSTPEAWRQLSTPVSLEQALENLELANQYRIQYGKDCKYLLKSEKDLWYCPCGALNHTEETTCHSCKKDFSVLSSLDLDFLKNESDKRLTAEQEKAAKQKIEEEKQRELMNIQFKKGVKIAIPILIVAGVVTFVGIQKQKEAHKYEDAYVQATQLLESKKYSEAAETFKMLSNINYDDSSDKALCAEFANQLEISLLGTSSDKLPEDISCIQSAIDLYEDFAPYCGEYRCIENPNYTLHSDFQLTYNNNIRWIPEISAESQMKIPGSNYIFYADPKILNDHSGQFENAGITQTHKGYYASIEFKNGDIFYTLTEGGFKESSVAKTLETRHYKKIK